MKKNRGKFIFILICIALSLYFLYPTYKDYTFTKQMRSLVGEDSLKYTEEHDQEIRDARGSRIKLGLDLQGGMRVVLEVNTLKLIEDLAKNKDDAFKNVIAEMHEEVRTKEQDIVDLLHRKFQEKQLRLSRYYGNIRDGDDDLLTKLRDESINAVDRAMEIVRNRIDQYGVSEPSIQKQGGRRIIVELPGVTKEAEVRQLLQGTALLEFKLLVEPEIASKVYESIDKFLAGKPLVDSAAADTSKSTAKQADAADAADTNLAQLPDDSQKTEEQLRKEHPFFSLAGTSGSQEGWNGELYTLDENRAKVIRILERPEIQKLIPSDMMFVWSARSQPTEDGKKIFSLYAVKKNAELTGGVIVNSRANIDPTYNSPIVDMEMNNEGAKDWARITGANVKKRIAIILDNSVYSAPVVQNKISGGRSQITGMESVDEARNLSIVLNAGALPAPVEIIQQTSVGPSLGEDSIAKGIYSSIVAFGLTILFMIFYYRSGGAIADIALLLNLLFTLAVLAGFQGTLTLPGIAGMILTMAIAVDANVLIFERIREESVTGKTQAAAIDTGYSRAFTAIFDSNLTTLISAIILYKFGTGPIQGFAVTLMIGIIASMFSAIVITRVIFDLMLERGKSINIG